MGRVFEWLLPQPVDDCLRVLSSCLLGGKSVTPLMCSTSETIGNNSADDGEDTVSCPFTVIMKGSYIDLVVPRSTHAATVVVEDTWDYVPSSCICALPRLEGELQN